MVGYTDPKQTVQTIWANTLMWPIPLFCQPRKSRDNPLPSAPGIHGSDFHHSTVLLPALELHINGIQQYVLFCVWLLVQRVCEIHPYQRVDQQFIPLYWVGVHHLHILHWFPPLPVDSHLRCFQLGALTIRLLWTFLLKLFGGHVFISLGWIQAYLILLCKANFIVLHE